MPDQKRAHNVRPSGGRRMKKTFINEIRAGDLVDDVFVLAEKTLSQKRDGQHYLNMVLSDKTGRIKGVMWEKFEQITADLTSGDFVHVNGAVSEYRGELQIVAKGMAPRAHEAVNPADFVPVTRRNVDEMFRRLVKIADSLKTDDLHTLLQAFWRDEEFVRKFKAAPAAKKMHHAYVGGLLEHTLSMAILTEKIAEHYSGIDRDLLITGAILHDIGKTEEFEYASKIDYSDQGRLLNHIIIGLKMIDEKLAHINGFAAEQALLLKHMIVSHHGARELGSPEPPKTMEAVLLNYIDEIDSKINGIRDFIAAEDSGETWTAYHRLLGRYFYRGKG